MDTQDKRYSAGRDLAIRTLLGAEDWGILRAVAGRLGVTPQMALRACVEREGARLALRSDTRSHVAPAAAWDALPGTADEALSRYRRVLRLSSDAMAGLLGIGLATYRKYQGGGLRVPLNVLLKARLLAREVVAIDDDGGWLALLPGVRPAWDLRGRKRFPIDREPAAKHTISGGSGDGGN